MNNGDYNNIPKPKYVKEYRKFNTYFKPGPERERTLVDKFILQTFISLIIVSILLLTHNVNAVIFKGIKSNVKQALEWDIDISKAIETFSDIRNVIPEAKKRSGIFDAASAPNEEPGFIMPLTGEITSGFGEREHPVFKTIKMHNGIDIDGEIGTPIKAAVGGQVIKVAQDETNGKYVKIENGKYTTTYAHCLKISVQEGQSVKQGDIIGEVGDTGIVSGPHLHFEILEDGKPIDPLGKINS